MNNSNPDTNENFFEKFNPLKLLKKNTPVEAANTQETPQLTWRQRIGFGGKYRSKRNYRKLRQNNKPRRTRRR
jgi:hypothetical protein